MSRRDPTAEVVAVAQSLNARGINQGTAGNVSARTPDGLVITPSAMAYADMTAADLVWLGLDGTVRRGARPSTEWRLHAGILAARPDVDAVVHVHPVHATALACLRRDIPAFHYMVAVAGGDSIRCAPYATFGTEDLAQAAVAALARRRACLLANHGLVAVGASPAEAAALAVEVEALAAMYLAALSVGEPALLSANEMADVLRSFASYRTAGTADG